MLPLQKNAIKNHFNYKDAFVVPSQGKVAYG
jgi:hypothetical protein